MELDTFITETLKAIIKGIKDSQESAIENGGIINPVRTTTRQGETTKTKNGERYLSKIEFDIAVTISKEKDSGVKGSINIVSAMLGANMAEKNIGETVSRIKFCIEAALPESTL